MAFANDNMDDSPSDVEKDIDMKKDLGTRVSFSSELSGSTIPPPPYHQSHSTQGFQNPIPELPIKPSTIFTIQAQGTRFIRIPTPSRELEIAVFNGTDTSAEPVYISTRAKRSSGNAVLRHFIKGDLLATTYRFGPFREPEIRRIDANSDGKFIQSDEPDKLAVKISTGGCVTSRAVTVTNPDDKDKTFTWDYKKIKTSGGKQKVIVLSMKDASPASSWKKDQILAALIRTDDTRTPGTRKSDAGNGGRLILDEQATAFMGEEMIIATCLMLLKKEIDRQRIVQAAIIAGAAGGGGG